jgi:hypothetical protein
MLNLHTADYAKLLNDEPGRYLLLERAVPRGRLKGDLVTLKDAEGRDLEIHLPIGARLGPVTVPIPIFNDLARSKLVYQESDDGTKAVFRPMPDERLQSA